MGNSEDTPKPPPKTSISYSGDSRPDERRFRPESNPGFRSLVTERQGYPSPHIPQERVIQPRPYTPYSSTGVAQDTATSYQGSIYKSNTGQTSSQPYVPSQTGVSKASPALSHPLSGLSQSAQPATFQGYSTPKTQVSLTSTYAPAQQTQVKSAPHSTISGAQTSQSNTPSPYPAHVNSEGAQYKSPETQSQPGFRATEPTAPESMSYYKRPLSSIHQVSAPSQVPQNTTYSYSSPAPSSAYQAAQYPTSKPDSVQTQVKTTAPVKISTLEKAPAPSSAYQAAQYPTSKPDSVQTQVKTTAPVKISTLEKAVLATIEKTHQSPVPSKVTVAPVFATSSSKPVAQQVTPPIQVSHVQNSLKPVPHIYFPAPSLQSIQNALPRPLIPSNLTSGSAPSQNPAPASASSVHLPQSNTTCRVRFADLSDYQDHFLRLLGLERKEVASDVNAKLAKATFHIAGSRGKRTIYRLSLASLEDFNYGDQFLLRYKEDEDAVDEEDEVKEVVHIHNIDEETHQIELLGKYDDAVSIEYYQSIPHRRMTEKLKSITENHPLLPLLLGDSSDNAYEHPWSYVSTPALDECQNSAVRQALCSKITLVHGPPGSGKTGVASNIVLELSKRAGKMLVCAPSNVATDNLALRIRSLKLNVVRFYSKGSEKKENIADHFAFHSFLHTLACVSFPEKAGNLLSLRNHSRNAVKTIIGEEEVVALEKEVLESFQIICCTCVASADAILKNFEFDYVIIDEAAFCTEPEALIPIAAGCKKVILIGDPKQLQPIVFSEEAKQQCYNISLFERLENARFEISMLAVQYRMHPIISAYPRLRFYGGKLTDGVDSAKRSVEKYTVSQLFPRSPVVFVRCEGEDDFYQGTTSRWNKKEADLVLMLLKRFSACEVHWKSIGVVTPYEGQRQTLTNLIQQELPQTSPDVEIKNIDGYQGREKDFIILSCVRSINSHTVGFLTFDNRINVALTRARFGLIVIGNENTLRSCSTWGGFLDYVQSKGDMMSQKEFEDRSEEYVKKQRFGYT